MTNIKYGLGDWKCLQKHQTQIALPTPQHNIYFVPTHYVYSPQSYITSGCFASIIALIRPLHVSNLTTQNKVDTDINVDNNSYYFVTPINNNHSATEFSDTNTAIAQVWLIFNSLQCQ